MGTRFWVVNGEWTGEILEKNGEKWSRVVELGTEYLIKDDRELIITIYTDKQADEIPY